MFGGIESRDGYETKKDLTGLQYLADMDDLLTILRGWVNKSDNKELEEFSQKVIRVFFYVNELERERLSFDNIITEMRDQKNKALIKLQEIKDKLNKYEDTAFKQ